MKKQKLYYDMIITNVPVERAVEMMQIAHERGLKVDMKAVDAPAGLTAVPAAKPRNFKYHDGKRNKGISGPRLLRELLTSGPKSQNELEHGYVARGFAPKSAGPNISNARAEGWVVLRGDKYCLAQQAEATDLLKRFGA